MSNDESLIKGIIITVVKDGGPEIVANLSPIPEENALITSLHLVSLAGLDSEDRTEDDSKMIGPLPVKGTSEYKSLYYSNSIKNSTSKDERILEHGSVIGVILLFDANKLPDIRRAAGLIEPYLELYLSKISEADEINKEFSIKFRDHLIEIISKPRIRTFWMDEEGIYEYKDPNYVSQADDVMILDEYNKKMFILTQKGTSVFSVRKMYNMVNELNFNLYQGAFQIVSLESYNEIEPLLKKHDIKVR